MTVVDFELIILNHTYIHRSKHRIANMTVCNKEHGLNEAEDKELERVDLADENPKGDEDCGSAETSFQNSKKVEKFDIKRIFSYFRFYTDDSIAIIRELPISSKYPRFCKKIFAQAVGGSDIASYKEGFCISWVSFWTYLLALLTLS